MVTNIVNSLAIWIAVAIIYKITNISIILFPIGYFVLLFSSLIYNELIIFNCCNLNKNTKKFVNKRIYKELEEIQKMETILQSEADEDSLMTFNNNNN